jgi:hypothetical protein
VSETPGLDRSRSISPPRSGWCPATVSWSRREAVTHPERVAVAEDDLVFQPVSHQVRPVLAPEVLEPRRIVLDDDAGVPARDVARLDTDRDVRVATDDVLSGLEGDHALLPDHTVHAARLHASGHRRRTRQDIVAGGPKGITVAVYGAEEPRLARLVPDHASNLDHEVRQIGLDHEGVRPQEVMEGGLRERLRTVLHKGLQELIGLGREVHGLAVTQELACVGVQDEMVETKPHRTVRLSVTLRGPFGSRKRFSRGPEPGLRRT